MPTVLRTNGFRFFFYMNEHLPIHVHVSKGGAKARVTLVPDINIDSSNGFKANEIKQYLRIIIDNYNQIINSWNDTFHQ